MCIGIFSQYLTNISWVCWPLSTGGLKPFLLNAVIGGIMLGMIEGFGHLVSTTFAPPQNQAQEPLLKTSFGMCGLRKCHNLVSSSPISFSFLVSVSIPTSTAMKAQELNAEREAKLAKLNKIKQQQTSTSSSWFSSSSSSSSSSSTSEEFAPEPVIVLRGYVMEDDLLDSEKYSSSMA
jgi:hypothetical protein